jgi:hypothetical protein
MRVLAFDHFLVMALEAQRLQVVLFLDPEEQRLDAASVWVVAVGAVLRRVVNRLRRPDLLADLLVAADAEVRGIVDGELVQVFRGLVALLTFPDSPEVGPVEFAVLQGFGVALAARARSGGIDRLGGFRRARRFRRCVEE